MGVINDLDDGGKDIASAFGLGWAWGGIKFLFKWTIGLIFKLVFAIIAFPFKLIFGKKRNVAENENIEEE